MSWIPVIRVPLNVDLSQLSHFLRARGLMHRITEEGTHQQLWVQDPALVEPVQELVQAWIEGKLDLPEDRGPAASRAMPSMPSPRQFPATLSLLLFSALGALIGMQLVAGGFLPWLTFEPLALTPGGVEFGSWSQAMARGELWRLITPAFLHFSGFHILFNGLWLWELGRRLEAVMGWQTYLLFVLVTALAANVAQQLLGSSLFGGMSGVVYALIGYIWMRQRYAPHPMLAVPPGLIGFMLVWLLLGLSGIIDHFIPGSVANGAHLGGLLAGMAWALLEIPSAAKRE